MAKTLRWHHRGLLGRIGDFWLGRKIITGGKVWESGKSEVYFRRSVPRAHFWKWHRVSVRWIGGPRQGTRRYGVSIFLFRRQADGPNTDWGRLVWHAGVIFRDLQTSPMTDAPRVMSWASRVKH